MPEGLDYAFGRPSATALHDAGVKFVCRYLSHSPSKNLMRSEANALTAAGIWIVVVWETTANRALAGRAAGVADAREAWAQARDCGMPDDRPIYFAVDWDASASQQAAINAYLDGAASILGAGRVGIYGGYGPVSRALAAGKAAWAWQTYAWSGGRWADGAHLQQYSNDHTLDGVGCDYNRSLTSDYGQWRVGVTPTTQEDDMAKVSSLGIAGKAATPQTIAAGTDADITWTQEFSDKHGLHGDKGKSVVIAKEKYWAHVDVTFCLEGLTPGAKLDVALTRVKDDGTFIDDAWRLPFVADEEGVVTGQLSSQFGVDATNRLRVRVYNTSDKPATVVASVLDRPVTMAKASLFSY
ncbi:DUF1906 domain-containing protein [Actinomadura sp. DC4]|uniref:DUF1906 domain-containing protein n=1 Tax=Actinomadura sp. DC4 TaxID=3055069 RepID=UPI0025AF4662|nr:DUF1906 domain-containing protein [Actinomadura sp. DC4]MDN3356095.1 DUF1906 domain-containing protein [Actinomadura sp. DC4]